MPENALGAALRKIPWSNFEFLFPTQAL